MRLSSPLLISLLCLSSTLYAGEIDVRLHDVIKRQVSLPDQAPPNVAVRVEGGQTMVSVIVRGDPATVGPAIRAVGGTVRSVVGDMMTVDLPIGQIAAVAGRADVVRMEAGHRVQLYNDLGNLAGGNASRTSAPTSSQTLNQGYGDGAGVIAAAVDTGIDIFHPDFRNPDGTTRVVYYWDQSDLGDSGTGVSGLTYGREYNEAEINAILLGQASLGASAKDTHGHGSHVMGTIAGNGRASNYQHAGVASKAPIIFVKFDFDGSRNTDTHIIDAVDYCFKRAAGTPCAVNLSLGTDLGPHDGTTYEEQMLNGLTGPGKVIFAAAGNAGELGTTTSVPMTHLPPSAPIHGASDFTGVTEIKLDLKLNALGRNNGTNNDYVYFDIWYDGAASCKVEVVTPGGATITDDRWTTGGEGVGRATPGRQGAVFVYNANDGNGSKDTLGWGTNNGDNELYVEISDAKSAGNVAEGMWTIRLIPVATSAPATVNGWHGLSNNFRGTPVTWNGTPTNNSMTVGSPATAANLISVGAYTTRVSWTKPDGTTFGYGPSLTVGTLSYFSSRGPDRNGNPHPAISAPGSGIISVLSADAASSWPADYLVFGGSYGVSQGTSMSTPNTTGVGVLALVRNGNLDPAGMRTVIQDGARTIDAPGAPNNDWGAGKLDVPGLMARPGMGGKITPPGVDLPPTIATIVSPNDGMTVSGAVLIEVNAADGEDAAADLTVVVLVDGSPVMPVNYNAGSGYWEATWTSAGEGGHTIGATVTDKAGQTTTAATVSVEVDNVDDAPTVAFVSIQDGDTVRGNPVALEVLASDDRSAVSVTITVDGADQGATFDGASGTWKADWDTSGLADGSSHVLSTTATAGAQSTTSTITVTLRTKTKGGKGGGGGGGGGSKGGGKPSNTP